MATLTLRHLRQLLAARESPCISLYEPTHRRQHNNGQDRLLFRNLLDRAEALLGDRRRQRDVQPVLEKLRALEADAAFWGRTLDGLAVLASPQRCDVFVLPRGVKEHVVVNDRFHVEPLLRCLQSADRFQVLCLTRTKAWVLEGDRYGLHEVDMGDFPRTAELALGVEDRTQPPYSAGTSSPAQSGAVVRRGPGSELEHAIEADTIRFFRVIDREVLARFSRPSGLPLVLAALTEHQTPFRSHSQNQHLLPEGVQGNPEAWSREELRQKVWAVVQPHYLARLERLKDDFRTAAARGAGSADLSDVARQAVAGRVATLLLEADRVQPGSIDYNTGELKPGEPSRPENGDMLNDLAEIVLLRDGEVVVVPKERMPTQTGLAAIYRY